MSSVPLLRRGPSSQCADSAATRAGCQAPAARRDNTRATDSQSIGFSLRLVLASWVWNQDFMSPRIFWVGGLFFWCVTLAACRPLPLLSYPYFWDSARIKPKDSDTTGTYVLSKVRLSSELVKSVNEKPSSVTLKSNHTAIFVDVPEFTMFGDAVVCRLSGSATWELDERREWGWIIVFKNYHPTMPTIPECGHPDSSWEGFQVLSRHAPYRLYMIVGDPDSDTGLEFEQEKK